MHPQVFTGGDVDIALHAANHTAHAGESFTVIRHFIAVAADRNTYPASGHQARFFLLEQVRLALALLHGAHGNVFFCPQVNLFVCHHVTAGDHNIFAADIDSPRRQHRADRQPLAQAVFGTGGGSGCQTLAFAGVIALCVMLFSLGGERDIPASSQLHGTLSLHFAGTQIDISYRL
ncbi:Uncharacterised protein [Yersinia ruckeri]|nr:Uncharacterised protein [Yersinia ruckeri]